MQNAECKMQNSHKLLSMWSLRFLEDIFFIFFTFICL